MPRPPSNAVQIALRIQPEWMQEADEIAQLISRPGFPATRTDAFRAAIARGFEALRADAAEQAAQSARARKEREPARKPAKK